MSNPSLKKGAKIRVKFFHKEYGNCYGTIIAVSKITGKVQVGIDGVGVCSFYQNEIVVIDRGGESPLDDAIKISKRKTFVCLIDGINSHHIVEPRRTVLELINNPHTYRVTIQHMNGEIYATCDREELEIARRALTHKRNYLWVICGGE